MPTGVGQPITVKATREGLIGQPTASGYVIDAVVPFVALPSVLAVRPVPMLIEVVNVANGRSCHAFVLDVGPWNADDDEYVFGSARPHAESGVDKAGRRTNGAGIDLGEAVWRELQMEDNGEVTWARV